MITINTIYVLVLILIFIIIFVTNILDIKNYELNKVLYESSLFFDNVSKIVDVKDQCRLKFKTFFQIKRDVDRYLTYINNLGYIKSRFFVMNKENCTFYDTNRNLKICHNFKRNKYEDCQKCRDFYNDFIKSPGKILSNNLLKKEGDKDITLYKTYLCKETDVFIIGIICQDKP